MKIRNLLLIIFVIFLFTLAYAQEKKYVVIEFESFGGNKTVTINLKEIFGKSYYFVHSETEHVDIKINIGEGTAVLKAKDPRWKGKERVVFAINKKALEEALLIEGLKKQPEKKEKKVGKEEVPKLKIDVEDVIHALEPILKKSFIGILHDIPLVDAKIYAYKTNDSLILDLNREIIMNISFAQFGYKPTIKLNITLNKTGLAPPKYEPKDTENYYLAVVIFLTITVIGFYLKFGENLFPKFKRRKKELKEEKLLEHIKIQKENIIGKIKALKGEKNIERAYKSAVKSMNDFLIEFLKLKDLTNKAVISTMKKKKYPQQLIDEVRSYLRKSQKLYSPEGVNKKDLDELLEKIEDIVKKI